MSRFDPALLERALRYAVRGPAPRRPTLDLEEALDLAFQLWARFEGWQPRPYLCPAGVWTIGYGCTYYLDGRRVRPTDAPISRETGERLARALLQRDFMPGVLRLCPNVDTEGRLAALTDFAGNLGLPRLEASTLRRRVNAGDWGLVPAEFRKWIVGGGKPLRGLILRREAEIALL